MLAYFDCFSGISGNMTLGALIDLGVSPRWLDETLREEVPLDGFSLQVTRVEKHGIVARHAEVRITDQTSRRNYSAIRDLIRESRLAEAVKARSLDIFKRLAVAEAAIHGCSVEEVHFHEVGGQDALVDIIGTALCLERLGIRRVISSKIPTGSGFVSAGHGRLPLPAPATLEILKEVPIYGTEIRRELVTPTGAAIIASLAESFEPLPELKVRNIGYGAGTANLEERPNLLRIICGDPEQVGDEELLVVIETNIDDMNPEIFGYLMDRLFEKGALDVYWIPIHMKKNRPGVMVQALCPPKARDALIRRLLSETTTTGVRHRKVRRRTLPRELISLETPYGRIPVKRIALADGTHRIVPEYEECRKIARERDIPIGQVYETIIRSAAL